VFSPERNRLAVKEKPHMLKEIFWFTGRSGTKDNEHMEHLLTEMAGRNLIAHLSSHVLSGEITH